MIKSNGRESKVPVLMRIKARFSMNKEHGELCSMSCGREVQQSRPAEKWPRQEETKQQKKAKPRFEFISERADFLMLDLLE